MNPLPQSDSISPGRAQFPETHWTSVLTAGDVDAPSSRHALERLCGKYWYPLYAYVRRRGYKYQDAEDLTQQFFGVLLEKNYIKVAQRERGKFRSFLLSSFNHFLSNEWDRKNALKRGGGKVAFLSDLASAETRYNLEPSHDSTPEKLFEREWAYALLEQATVRLEEEWKLDDKEKLFVQLKPFLMGFSEGVSYQTLAKQIGMTEGAVKIAIFRLRRRFREVLCEAISQTLERPEELDQEIRYFIQILNTSCNS